MPNYINQEKIIPLSYNNTAEESAIKAKVLLSILNTLQENLTRLRDHVFKITIWSSGIALIIPLYCILQGEIISNLGCIFLLFGLAALFLITQYFYKNAQETHNSIGNEIVKVQEAIGLYESNLYLKDKPYYVYSKDWLPFKTLIFCKRLNVLAILFSIIILIFILLVEIFI